VKRPIILLILLCALLLIALPLAQYVLKNNEAGKSGRCGQCGMELSRFGKTRYEIYWIDGTMTTTCGVQCGLTQHFLHQNRFKSAVAKDYFDGSAFDARRGYYVFGSRVLSDMAPGFIAFRSLADAERFRAESGGEVLGFAEALSVRDERKVNR
jgi:hypothetical protein